jgi:hypothetical protein
MGMEDQLMLEIKQLPEYLREEVKDFVKFLNNKLENGPAEKISAKKMRKAGFLKGSFAMSANFDEPLEDFKEYM